MSIAEPLISTAEAAALLGCAKATLNVDRCRRRWGVPFVRVGRLVRYRPSDLERWLAERNAVTAEA